MATTTFGDHARHKHDTTDGRAKAKWYRKREGCVLKNNNNKKEKTLQDRLIMQNVVAVINNFSSIRSTKIMPTHTHIHTQPTNIIIYTQL